MNYPCSIFFSFSLYLFLFVICNADSTDYAKREHSLVKPYQGSGMMIPFWDFLGHAIVTSNYVRLTPDLQSKQGAIWNTVPLQLPNWELQVNFKIHGKSGELFGDGLAIWYAKDRMTNGPAFGSKDYFLGLAVILDTYSNHNGPHNHKHPYISAMINNGTLHYDHDKDGTHTQLAGCESSLRNVEHDTQIAIRYVNNQLSVLTDVENKGSWKECFSIEGIRLPPGYYIGLSATTGDLSDNHDIIGVRLYQLDTGNEDKLLEERRNILPSATFYEAPRERTEDAPSSGSWVKTFLWMMLVAIILISLVVAGIMYYQNQQENSRKRFY